MIEMKNSGVEWIGEIPDEWNIYRNKNAFTCKKEIVGKKSNSTQLLSLTTGGIKCKDINNAEGKLPESFDTYQYVKKNDVVMCLFDLDMSAVFSGISQYDGMISPAYKVLSCQDRTNPLFIHYWFSYIFDGRKFNHYAKNIRYTLNYDEFAILPIPLPPVYTQQRIASYLDSKCSKIEETIQNQQQVIEKLKAYKQSLITEVVTGKIKIKNGKVCGKYESYKKSGIDWIETIPDTWCVCKIKYICTMQAGKTLSSEMISEKGLYPVYGGNGKRGFYTEYNTEGKYILIGRQGALCGNVHLVNGKFWATEHAVVTTPNRDVGINYLFYLLSSMNLNQYVSSTAAQPGLSVSTIINLKTIIIKSIDDQKSIVDYLDKKCTAIDTAIEQKQKLIEKLTEYKKSLIYECVTGKKEC